MSDNFAWYYWVILGTVRERFFLIWALAGKIPLLRPERWRRFKEEAACFGAGWKTSHLRPIRCNFDAITCFFFGASTDFSHLRRVSPSLHRKASYLSAPALFFLVYAVSSPVISKKFLDFGAGGKIPLLRPERWRRFKEEAACFGAGWKTSHLRPIRCNFDAITCFFFGASTDFSHLRRPSHRPASKSMLFFGASSIFSPLHRIHHKSPPEIPIIHKCSVTPKPTPTFPTKNVMHFRA